MQSSLEEKIHKHLEHNLERQRNVISFAVFSLKNISILSSAAVVALLALLAEIDWTQKKNLVEIIVVSFPGFVLSLICSILCAYFAYWSELIAFNRGVGIIELIRKGSAPETISYHENIATQKEHRFFRRAHYYYAASILLFFIALAYFTLRLIVLVFVLNPAQ